MKVARIKSPKFVVGWVVVSAPTVRVLFDEDGKENGKYTFAGIEGKLPEHASAAVICRISSPTGDALGLAGCDSRDTFYLETGMKKSLSNALADLKGLESLVGFNAADVWEFVLADKTLGPALRGETLADYTLATVSQLAAETNVRLLKLVQIIEAPQPGTNDPQPW